MFVGVGALADPHFEEFSKNVGARLDEPRGIAHVELSHKIVWTILIARA